MSPTLIHLFYLYHTNSWTLHFMDFNLFLALFIFLLRFFQNCQQKPLKACSWVFFFFFFFAYPNFLSHLITFLYKISQAHLLLFLKAAIFEGVQVPFMGGRYSQNKIWVPGVLLAMGVSASMTSQQDSSSQSLGKTFPSGDTWQCLEVHDCHNWGDSTEI